MNDRLLKLYVKLQNLVSEEHGQDLVEYALLVTLIALGAISGVSHVATAVKNVFRTSALPSRSQPKLHDRAFSLHKIAHPGMFMGGRIFLRAASILHAPGRSTGSCWSSTKTGQCNRYDSEARAHADVGRNRQPLFDNR